jgi:hypothetical protein
VRGYCPEPIQAARRFDRNRPGRAADRLLAVFHPDFCRKSMPMRRSKLKSKTLLIAAWHLPNALASLVVSHTLREKVGECSVSEANQSSTADDRFLYAITNTLVAKYDQGTGQRVAVSTGKAEHLNSGFLWDGRVYCAHSNYPKLPEQSKIMVLDPETMRLSTFKDFGNAGGSLTWAVRHEGN